MNKMIKFLWAVSVLIFLLLLLWVYSYLPEQVALSRDNAGLIITHQISRGSFFYSSLTVFIVSNLILYIVAKLVRLMPKGSSMPVNHTAALRLEGWAVSFSWALNICYMFLLVYFGLFNNPGSFRYAGYSHLLIYMIPVIILLWLFALVFLLLKRGRENDV